MCTVQQPPYALPVLILIFYDLASPRPSCILEPFDYSLRKWAGRKKGRVKVHERERLLFFAGHGGCAFDGVLSECGR